MSEDYVVRRGTIHEALDATIAAYEKANPGQPPTHLFIGTEEAQELQNLVGAGLSFPTVLRGEFVRYRGLAIVPIAQGLWVGTAVTLQE